MTYTIILPKAVQKQLDAFPFQIKSIAIKDACQAVKKAKADFKKDGQIRRCKFRSRKDIKQSVYIPKSAIKDCDIYHTIVEVSNSTHG
jgi:putative transposase